MYRITLRMKAAIQLQPVGKLGFNNTPQHQLTEVNYRVGNRLLLSRIFN